MSGSTYIETDEFDDVVSSLTLAIENLEKMQDQPWRWKWVILAMHNALQGACACYLTKTDGTGALRTKSEEAIAKAFYGAAVSNYETASSHLHVAQLANFPDLVNRAFPEIEIGKNLDWKSGRSEEEKAVRLLHSLRNDFQHFKPKGWSLEITGLTAMVVEIAKMILKLTSERRWRRYNRFSETAIAGLLDNLIQQGSDT